MAAKPRLRCDLRLEPAGSKRYRVLTPFTFADGDHFTIVLKQEGDSWLLSDEGHTYMHLSYRIDEEILVRGSRRAVIDGVLRSLSLQERDGEFVLPIADDSLGEAVFRFAQALTRIGDVAYLTREGVLSAFTEDFRTLIGFRA